MLNNDTSLKPNVLQQAISQAINVSTKGKKQSTISALKQVEAKILPLLDKDNLNHLTKLIETNNELEMKFSSLITSLFSIRRDKIGYAIYLPPTFTNMSHSCIRITETTSSYRLVYSLGCFIEFGIDFTDKTTICNQKLRKILKKKKNVLFDLNHNIITTKITKLTEQPHFHILFQEFLSVVLFCNNLLY